ncbi:Transketolase [Patulibacter medicamentivorans]|uniref:Transketolase n=1 Tax=Patulibacter medicamentivorans TaxID=1097667 RepID=H0E5A8_9ACTN|nr:transketolase [Patulibacter medicamentivorans]EHN11141.1 Transketolase [Patulibacter medicamentivorans]
MSSDAAALSINTIRTLSIDAVQQANSGHPGLPLAFAPVAYLLYAERMKHDPADPSWPDRDRFVLSAGHGSMLQYATLHLAGYDLTLDDLKAFRQWGSRTPGHPERESTDHATDTGNGIPASPLTPGIEVTTGPLGQGISNAVGLAAAEQFLREHFGSEVQDHRTYVIASDGDLMEGVASEAASFAGHVGLGRLVVLYDDNDISLDGPTSLSFDEDVEQRFQAYGWQTLRVTDVNDLDALRAALDEAEADEARPTLIHVKSIIGWPSPNKQGTSKAHGSPLGEDEVRLTKEALGWDPDARFLVPDGVREQFAAGNRGPAEHAAWKQRFAAWRAADGDRAAAWDAAWAGKPLPGLKAALRAVPAEKEATRISGKRAMAAFAPFVPTLVGGAADLASSTNTVLPEAGFFTREGAGQNVHFGVREHGMGAIVNGLAAHGGIVRPYGSTFMQFVDYMRGAVRLSALQNLSVAWVYTHDSVALGEDGPTHQPVEHLASMRAIPNLTVIRPGDSVETQVAWATVLEDLSGPAVLAFSRQGIAPLPRDGGDEAAWAGVPRGGYVVSDPEGEAAVVLVGTGAEVGVAVAAAALLAQQGIGARVVSLPSWELFDAQDEAYRQSVLPVGLPAVSVEAGVTFGWERYVDAAVGIDRFGASAPGGELLEKLGITAEAVAERAHQLLGD